ncbi:MAG TPA: glutathione S-transferase family protein [Polyangiaceae bacterium]|nr:glutathione S-transferase family protein [Polyangiaceae bacterium]
MHPVSMTSRPVRLFIAEHGLDVEEKVVDLMTGEHHQPAFIELNPNRLVPVLEDGDLRLTESSAILKHLADKIGSPTYPKDLKQRARVNERMDWFNTNFYRDYAYNLIYPQIFPHHKRQTDDVQAATLAWGKQRSQTWLSILNDHIIGPQNQYVCGNEITIADYFGISLLTLGEIVGCDFAEYPNVARWVANMKKLKSWQSVNEALYNFRDAVAAQSFEKV